MLKVKIAFCFILSAISAYIFHVYIDTTNWVTLAFFALMFWAFWGEGYPKFVGWAEDRLGLRITKMMGLTKPKASDNAGELADQLFDSGPIDLSYEDDVNRKVEYESRGRRVKKNFGLKFRIVRNTAGMTPPEREAARAINVLRAERLITTNTFSRLQFSLVWGDGRAQSRGKARFPSDMGTFFRWHGFEHYVQFEAQHRGANCQGAIGEAFGLLNQAAMDSNAPEVVKRLNKELTDELFPTFSRR